MTPVLKGLLLAGAALVTFALSWALTAGMSRLARRIGYVDRPGAHKSHRQVTPYGGGIAIFLALCLPILLALAMAHRISPDVLEQTFGTMIAPYIGGIRDHTRLALFILGGGFVLHVLGIIDDLRPLGAYSKLLVIAAVAAAISGWGELRLVTFLGSVISVLLTTLWIIVVTNAFNFLDNMDGLSAGVAAICLAALAACGLLAGQFLVPALACIFLGAVAGFLVLNFPPARIFMGDAGSLLVGFMLAVTSIRTTYYETGGPTEPYALAMPLVILAVPLYDFATVVLIRIAEKRNPLRGDQRHFSHRLVDRGLSRRAAVLTIYLATATTCLAATLLPQAGLRETLTIGAVVLLVLAIIAVLESPPRSA